MAERRASTMRFKLLRQESPLSRSNSKKGAHGDGWRSCGKSCERRATGARVESAFGARVESAFGARVESAFGARVESALDRKRYGAYIFRR